MRLPDAPLTEEVTRRHDLLTSHHELMTLGSKPAQRQGFSHEAHNRIIVALNWRVDRALGQVMAILVSFMLNSKVYMLNRSRRTIGRGSKDKWTNMYCIIPAT
jgi:hypothetical protein